ncbi:MAG: MFS transporter, partial [Lautropia sp.]
ARLMSLLMLVFSVAPILAPIAGSLVDETAGWRAIFWSIAGLTMVGIVMVAVTLPETRPPAARAAGGLGAALSGYRILLSDRAFLGLMATGACGAASFHAYLAGSSFALINHYHLTPRQYSLAFAVNAMSFILAAQWTARLGLRFGLRSVVRGAALAYAVTMLSLLLLYLAGIDRVELLIAFLLVGYGFLGLVIPATSVLALDAHGARAGTASALIGTGQFVFGACAIAISGRFTDGTARPMVATIAACAALACALAWLSLRDRTGRQPVAPAANRPV